MQPGITGYREALGDLPGAQDLIMRCEDGGKVQAFSIGETTIRVDASAKHEEVRQAFLDAYAKINLST